MNREAIAAAAEEILEAGFWCVLEACIDIPRQVWERRLVIFRDDGDAVADVVAEWVDSMPHRDARLSGCARDSLRSVFTAPTHLCYLAERVVN